MNSGLQRTFYALSPAKLIITGEHSVIYGGPAYVMAINRFARASIQSHDNSTNILFHLVDLRHTASVTWHALSALRKRLLHAYHRCLTGDLKIREVLAKPTDLFQFALSTLINSFQVGLTKGFNVELTSDIPIGCGMGSSAATLLSVVKAIAHYLQIDLNADKLYKVCLEAERLQHGKSSGVDPYICLHGGFVRFQEEKTTALPMPDMPFYLVNTGKPNTTTGECVMQVAEKFAQSIIWNEFSALSEKIAEQLCLGNTPSSTLKSLIRYNHRLLNTIGVVPPRVSSFIHTIEQIGGAAKICGAGATSGNAAGAILVIAEHPPLEICNRFGYDLVPIKGESLGTRLI